MPRKAKPAEPETAAGPEPFMAGTFAVYERPDGSIIFAWNDTVNGGSGQRVVPAAMVKLGRRMASKAAANGQGPGVPLLLDGPQG